MEHDALAGTKAFFEIRAVKKFAEQRATAGVSHEEVIDGPASAAVTHQAAIGDFGLQRVGAAGLDFAQRREMNAVFIAKRQITE